jgi:hypothetical protein
MFKLSKKNNNRVENLNSILQLVMFEDSIDSVNRKMKSFTKKRNLKALLVCTPLFLSIILFIIFKIPLIIIIGTGIATLDGIITIVKDIIRAVNNKGYSDTDFINDDPEEEIDKIFEESFVRSKAESYYTERYKELLKSKEKSDTEQEKKYREALVKQKCGIYNNSANLRIVEDETFLDKADSIERIMYEIDTYLVAYELPPLDVTDKEWDLFFDSVYDFLAKRGLESSFYDLVSFVEKYTFAKTLYTGKKEININSFIDNLDHLTSENIAPKDIANLQKTISSEMSSNVIDFSAYLKRKRNNKK